MASANFSPDVGDGYVSIGAHYDRGDGFFTTPADQRGPADVRARYENWSTSVRAVASIDADTDIQARARLSRRSHPTLRRRRQCFDRQRREYPPDRKSTRLNSSPQ